MCFGQIVGAIGAQKQARFDEQVAERTAKVHKIQAAQAIIGGEMDAARVGREFSQLVGRQRATFASQGFDVSVGDPVRLTEATLAVGRQEQGIVQYNAQLDAWAATEAAVGAIQAGKAARFRGNIAMTAGIVGGITSIGTTALALGRGFGGLNTSSVGKLLKNTPPTQFVAGAGGGLF